MRVEIVEEIVRGGSGGRIIRKKGRISGAKHFNGGKREGEPVSGRSHNILELRDR